MDAILRGLGYAPRLRYEKFRCVWELAGGPDLFLDILPFGHFLEIEASPEAIGSLARGSALIQARPWTRAITPCTSPGAGGKRPCPIGRFCLRPIRTQTTDHPLG
jgi:hypothetical protein